MDRPFKWMGPSAIPTIAIRWTPVGKKKTGDVRKRLGGEWLKERCKSRAGAGTKYMYNIGLRTGNIDVH